MAACGAGNSGQADGGDAMRKTDIHVHMNEERAGEGETRRRSRRKSNTILRRCVSASNTLLPAINEAGKGQKASSRDSECVK